MSKTKNDYKADVESKTTKAIYDELLERFNRIKTFIIEHFGERGKALFDYTLIRIGAFDPKTGNLNLAALKGDFDLPYIKSCDDGSTEIGNLVFADVEFSKVDAVNHIVSGYVNTVTCDVYDDIFLPEAYIDSLKEHYLEKGNPIYFMHHTDIAAGQLLDLRSDDVGVYVVTKPYPEFWNLFENKILRGFSVGGNIKIWPDIIGNAYVSHRKYSLNMPDISYVTRPANMLSYYDGVAGESETQRINRFVADKHRPMKQKFKSASKNEKTQDSKSFLLTSPDADSSGDSKVDKNNKVLKGKLNLSNEERENKTLSIDEHIKKLLEERDEENKRVILEKLQMQRSEELKEREEERLVKVEKELGIIKGEVNTALAEMKKMFTELSESITKLDGKIQKMEDDPEYKKAAPDSTDKNLKPTKFDSMAAALQAAEVL